MHGAANSRMRRMTATIALPFIGVKYCASNRDVCRDQVVAGVFGHVVADPETALARVPRDDADDGGPRERPLPRLAAMSRSRCASPTCRRHSGCQGSARQRSGPHQPQTGSPKSSRPTWPRRASPVPPGRRPMAVGHRRAPPPRARPGPAPPPVPGWRSAPAPAGSHTGPPGQSAWAGSTAARPRGTRPCLPAGVGRSP
jgi:hypothetical protein